MLNGTYEDIDKELKQVVCQFPHQKNVGILSTTTDQSPQNVIYQNSVDLASQDFIRFQAVSLLNSINFLLSRRVLEREIAYRFWD